MRRFLAALCTVALCALSVTAPTAAAATHGQPTASGRGGAAATVDPDATRAALEVLDAGGNAVDAAVAAAGVLGVTEPYSSGLGGGGFMLVYLADSRRVVSIDSRETAPRAYRPRIFVGDDGKLLTFPERVTSGLGVGVPGTPLGWEEALRRYGTWSLGEALEPGIRVARRGFVVDDTFAAQTRVNLERFEDFTSTRALFLTPDGQVPAVGSRLRNPDLAATYRRLARHGTDVFYRGPVAEAIVRTVTDPPLAPGADRTVHPGVMRAGDLADYETRVRPPTSSDFDGYQVHGMGPPSSGGSTVGEILNILEGFDATGRRDVSTVHRYLEASRLAFADRNAYLGDPEYTNVPLDGLLSDGFAAERRALIGPQAGTVPAPVGDPFDEQADPSRPLRPGAGGEGTSTTHLTVSDRWGNVVAYTLTIEQTGGSALAVPGHGFLLNNELTDFDPLPPHPNAPEAGKRPRSSIAPTIVLRDGEPVVALGTPGGPTIITTVAQVLYDHLRLGASLPAALATPRAAQMDSDVTVAEPALISSPLGRRLRRRGHAFVTLSEVATFPIGDDIGAATGIR
ncbi:MAG: gamma-glutamyltransferase, partial [Actinomycetota bacterium]|nr:gamma-glutamyltransferase [Actinomycetota bacterium]